MSTKSVLIINRTPPYGSSSPREALDVALTCSIFEQPVSLLFLGAGLFQLLNNQHTESIDQKNLESIMSSLPMYDIDQ
ncbi:MAG: DsrE family protein, partial [Neptuniibacter sp.]